MSKRLNSLKLLLTIGIGGMIGASSRYGISIGVVNATSFPMETLLANLIGCFILSFLLHYASIKKKLSKEVFTGLTTGILGSFTTFSTFAVETVTLGHQSITLAILYVFISVVGGVLLCLLGYHLAIRKQEHI